MGDGRELGKKEYLFWPGLLALMSGSTKVAPRYLAMTTASATYLIKQNSETLLAQNDSG